ncbi:MAG: response regulator [Proteobacteria bacterium]|nr:response regulator [Pseudomonadota bacterium]
MALRYPVTTNFATLVSLSASLLLVGMGVIFLALANSPGWRRARVFVVIAFSAAAYAAVNVMFSQPKLDEGTARIIGLANYLLAAIHVSAWIASACSTPEHPFRDLSRRLRWIVGITLGLGVLALVPGVATTAVMGKVEVPWLGVVYRQAVVTPFGDALSIWLIGVLAIPFARFIRGARRHEPGAGVRVVAFAIFYVCAIVEVLVTNGVIEFLYTADLGFLAIVASLVVDTVRRVTSDAQALELLSRDLASQVDARTLERNEAVTALQHAERLAALGRLAGGIGHEINNPLTYVRANLELLGEMVGEVVGATGAAEAVALIDESLGGVDRIARVIRDLRAYARPGTEPRELVSVHEVLRSAMQLANHEQHLTVATAFATDDERGMVSVDAGRLSQVFFHLLVNAGHAVREASRAEPRIVARTRLDDGWVIVEIEDNGVGVSEEMLGRLGEPYFTTRAEHGGVGLGLFVSRGVLASFGGVLELESTPSVGTIARVRLPVTRAPTQTRSPSLPAREPAPAVPTLPSVRTGRRRALIVDDEPAVARVIARLMRDFDVTIASDGLEALRLIEHDQGWDVVLCDVMMPRMTGVELYERLRQSAPMQLERFVFVTGGATIPEVASFLDQENVRHLVKPFDRVALQTVLRWIA